MLKITFLQEHKVQFHDIDLNRKLSASIEFFDLRILKCILGIRILIVQKRQKKLFSLIYLNIQTLISPWILSWLLSSKPQLKTSNCWEFLRKISDSVSSTGNISNVSKGAHNYDLSRFSKSHLSVTTSLISSMVFSIECLKLVEKSSIEQSIKFPASDSQYS